MFRPLALAAVALAVCVAWPRRSNHNRGNSSSNSTPQQPPPQDQPQPPVFRAGINFVRVDVIITDKNGTALADLQPGDFEVLEDGKPQKIETFKFVKLDGGTADSMREPPKPIRSDYDEESEAARDDVRLFAVFLDDYHVRRGTSLAVRDPLSRFIETQLGPSDMIGLMYPLEQLANLRMTRNHEAIEKAIQQFVGRKFEYSRRTSSRNSTRTIRPKPSNRSAIRFR